MQPSHLFQISCPRHPRDTAQCKLCMYIRLFKYELVSHNVHKLVEWNHTSRADPITGFVAALDTRMSIPPKSWIVWLMSFVRSSLLPTWQTWPFIWSDGIPCLVRSVSSAFWTFFSFRLLIMTLAPSLASRFAMARPILNKHQKMKCKI